MTQKWAWPPVSLEQLFFCVHHLPGSTSLGWAGPYHLHQSQYPELTGPGFCELASLAGRPTPLPLSCFEAAHNHPRQGCWVMWSGGFRVTPPPFFLCHPFRPQPPCFCRKHTLPVPFPARSPPLPSSVRRHSLCCPGSARCRKAAPGTRGTRRRAGQGWGKKWGVKAEEFRGG